MKNLIPIIVLFFFFSCRKDIITADKDYEGNWFGIVDTSVKSTSVEHSNFNIDSQSNLSYTSYDAGGREFYEFGGTAKIRGNIIHVNSELFPHRFKIISPPTQIPPTLINFSTYHWTMTLKGPEGWVMPYYK